MQLEPVRLNLNPTFILMLKRIAIEVDRLAIATLVGLGEAQDRSRPFNQQKVRLLT